MDVIATWETHQQLIAERERLVSALIEKNNLLRELFREKWDAEAERDKLIAAWPGPNGPTVDSGPPYPEPGWWYTDPRTGMQGPYPTRAEAVMAAANAVSTHVLTTNP